MPKIDDLLRHEAAHAVVASFRGFEPTDFWLVVSPDGTDWGGTVNSPGPAGVDEAVIALAGPVCDLRLGVDDADEVQADHR